LVSFQDELRSTSSCAGRLSQLFRGPPVPVHSVSSDSPYAVVLRVFCSARSRSRAHWCVAQFQLAGSTCGSAGLLHAQPGALLGQCSADFIKAGRAAERAWQMCRTEAICTMAAA
jgi:hypothetical protein